MDYMKDALLRMVKAARNTKKLLDAYQTVGLDDNLLFETYGEIADAIYGLVGEQTETFEESVTCLTMSAPFLKDERRAEMLYAEYLRNREMEPYTGEEIAPKPNTIERDELKKMVKKNGGYMSPEGDWE